MFKSFVKYSKSYKKEKKVKDITFKKKSVNMCKYALVRTNKS